MTLSTASSTKPLRKCLDCGLEALSQGDLEKFMGDPKCRYGRQNLCRDCRNKSRRIGGKYYAGVKRYSDKWNPIRHKQRITFKNKRIFLGENPRTNVCSECGKKYPDELKQQTYVHHDIYDIENPLKYTRELCASCHGKLHRKQQLENRNR